MNWHFSFILEQQQFLILAQKEIITNKIILLVVVTKYNKFNSKVTHKDTKRIRNYVYQYEENKIRPSSTKSNEKTQDKGKDRRNVSHQTRNNVQTDSMQIIYDQQTCMLQRVTNHTIANALSNPSLITQHGKEVTGHYSTKRITSKNFQFSSG